MAFECVLGHQPSLCPWDTTPTNILAMDEWFHRAQKVWEGAHTSIKGVVERFTHQANRHRRYTLNYKAEDRVWLSTRDIRLRLPSKKLSPHYIGPFLITA